MVIVGTAIENGDEHRFASCGLIPAQIGVGVGIRATGGAVHGLAGVFHAPHAGVVGIVGSIGPFTDPVWLGVANTWFTLQLFDCLGHGDAGGQVHEEHAVVAQRSDF